MMPIVLWLHHRLVLLLHDEKGATAVEYGLLVGLIAVAIIVTVTLLGDTLQGLFENVNTKLAPDAP
jgi:pilus assembly protein Flp/PilA